MMSNIFGNAPKWEAVKVTDNSNILDNIAKAYTSQKSAFDDLQTAWRTFASDAQKAHQQESINALNNMSVDELTAVDAQTGETAKEKFMADFAKRGEAIGGYNNQTAIDALYDQRINSAIADEGAMRVRNEVVRGEAVNEASDDLSRALRVLNGIYKASDGDRASAANFVEEARALVAKGSTNPDDPTVQGYTKAFSSFNETGGKEIANLEGLDNALAQYSYNSSKFGTWGNNHLNALALLSVGLDWAKATGDKTAASHYETKIKKLESEELAMREKFAGTDVLNYWDKHKTAIMNEYVSTHHKRYKDFSDHSLKLKAIEVDYAAIAAQNQRHLATLAHQGKELESKAAQAKAEAAKEEAEKNDPTVVGKASLESLQKSFGIGNPLAKDAKGDYTLNTNNINEGVMKLINASVFGKDLEARYQKAAANYRGKELNIRNVSIDPEEHTILNNAREVKGSLKDVLGDRDLTNDEVRYIALRAMEQGTGVYSIAPFGFLSNPTWVRDTYNEYQDIKQKRNFAIVQNVIQHLVNITNRSSGEIITKLGWLDTDLKGEVLGQFLRAEQYVDANNYKKFNGLIPITTAQSSNNPFK